MRCDDGEEIELQVIRDVLDTVEERLLEWERHGWRLTIPRSLIYATVLYSVIVSARAARIFPARLDRADILDAIFDGIEPSDTGTAGRPVEDLIRRHTVHVN
ncbi:hypothetical protein [Nocardia sp. NPDC050406]|uniref:hypothetical protein n=1 Tax=Nocardia sp. NPDC050406 TaxID=3364318 RepID=UPI0037B5A4D7